MWVATRTSSWSVTIPSLELKLLSFICADDLKVVEASNHKWLTRKSVSLGWQEIHQYAKAKATC